MKNLSPQRVNKFKSAIKIKNEVVLRLSNMIGDNETNVPHKLLLTDRQVSNLRKAFEIIHQQISNYQKLYYLR